MKKESEYGWERRTKRLEWKFGTAKDLSREAKKAEKQHVTKQQRARTHPDSGAGGREAMPGKTRIIWEG
ncbi:unnamed protein product [Clonostachys rhizophaga]|uniref:Uncharacterized protein n=1 Tax=Clonostachys rhizophaga TaxID=160324 RepID=A0A9N9VHT5_9HYPO|nr:unnamed protein product [Clonostachys rhizophaga]